MPLIEGDDMIIVSPSGKTKYQIGEDNLVLVVDPKNCEHDFTGTTDHCEAGPTDRCSLCGISYQEFLNMENKNA